MELKRGKFIYYIRLIFICKFIDILLALMICNSAGVYSRKNLLSGPIGGLASSLTYVCKCILQFHTDISSNYTFIRNDYNINSLPSSKSLPEIDFNALDALVED